MCIGTLARVAVCYFVAFAACLATSPGVLAAGPTTLGTARTIFVDSQSDFLSSSLLEERIQERPEFAKLGLAITRNANEADVFVEVRRSAFTTKFNYSVLDPRTRTVLASGRVNSLFGTASGKIAKKLMKQFAARRAAESAAPRPDRSE